MDPATIRKRVAKNIRRLAHERDLSLRALCDEADVSRSSLWRILSCEGAATTDVLTRIADALAVDVRALFE